MRTEVIIYAVIVSVFVISLLFYPVFEVNSSIYSQELSFLGFNIRFYNYSSTVFLPLPIAGVIYALLSLAVPLIWRKSRYSLYLSTVLILLSISMFISSYVYDERYLFYYDYSVLPTYNGAFLIYFPRVFSFNLPFYILVASAIISSLNSITRARWMPIYKPTLIEKVLNDLRQNEIEGGLARLFTQLNVPYALEEGGISVPHIKILKENRKIKEAFFPRRSNTAVIFIQGDKAYKIDDGEINEMNLIETIKFILEKIKINEIKKEKEEYL
ncbi:hypothetical protein [Acidianus sp. HS-5]|uniref:hypothetical protein n=1 Tax=Acidianus sp. HS-5 TaxID=2886040 RepID=UPI001F2F819B|nr:hypothetical protein [Acidianus sp. HS-5]BDC17214.1 hypothetical protein HS5_01040 [Acidianus sp. HS-5]